MTSEEQTNQQEWERDTRLWVPKRNPKLGWTINFARRGSIWTCLGLFTIPLGFVLVFVLLQLDR